jgi:hypothetical protein
MFDTRGGPLKFCHFAVYLNVIPAFFDIDSARISFAHARNNVVVGAKTV